MNLSYQAGRYGLLDTLNSKIHPLFQILDTGPGWCNNSRIGACNNSGGGGAGGGAGGVHLACRMGYDINFKTTSKGQGVLMIILMCLLSQTKNHEYFLISCFKHE